MSKLRIKQIIEVDLKLLMRIFLGIRTEYNYENEKIISKHDHGYRKGYHVESAFLEKMITLDLAKRTEDKVSHVISDLEKFYDRQLPNIEGIVEESIGVNKEAIKLVTKVLPRC